MLSKNKLPATPLIQKAKEDLNIQFLQGKGFSRQAWVCVGCPGEKYVQGDSYHGLGLHLESAKHKKMLDAQMAENEQLVNEGEEVGNLNDNE